MQTNSGDVVTLHSDIDPSTLVVLDFSYFVSIIWWVLSTITLVNIL